MLKYRAFSSHDHNSVGGRREGEEGGKGRKEEEEERAKEGRRTMLTSKCLLQSLCMTLSVHLSDLLHKRSAQPVNPRDETSS